MIGNQIILYKFIKTNKNVGLYSISFHYKLSENFIREFKNRVNWIHISIYQKLSEDLYVNSKIKSIGFTYQ